MKNCDANNLDAALIIDLKGGEFDTISHLNYI
jgi:hypothetical protein